MSPDHANCISMLPPHQLSRDVDEATCENGINVKAVICYAVSCKYLIWILPLYIYSICQIPLFIKSKDHLLI